MPCCDAAARPPRRGHFARGSPSPSASRALTAEGRRSSIRASGGFAVIPQCGFDPRHNVLMLKHENEVLYGLGISIFSRLSCRSIAGYENGVCPYPAVDLSLCKKCALTMFKAFPLVVLYHTAIFPGFLGSVIDHRQPHRCRALSHCPLPHSVYTAKAQQHL